MVKEKKNDNDQKGLIVALDGVFAGTSRAINAGASGYGAKNIHVPNSKVIRSDLCTHHPLTLVEYLRDFSYDVGLRGVGKKMGVFDAAIFDYCGTFGGNRQSSEPQADIEMLFARGLLRRDYGVFSCTASLRDPREKRADLDDRACATVHQNIVQQQYDYIVNTAHRYGYYLNLLNRSGQLYGGGYTKAKDKNTSTSYMVFMIFRSIPNMPRGSKPLKWDKFRVICQ